MIFLFFFSEEIDSESESDNNEEVVNEKNVLDSLKIGFIYLSKNWKHLIVPFFVIALSFILISVIPYYTSSFNCMAYHQVILWIQIGNELGAFTASNLARQYLTDITYALSTAYIAIVLAQRTFDTVPDIVRVRKIQKNFISNCSFVKKANRACCYFFIRFFLRRIDFSLFCTRIHSWIHEGTCHGDIEFESRSLSQKFQPRTFHLQPNWSGCKLLPIRDLRWSLRKMMKQNQKKCYREQFLYVIYLMNSFVDYYVSMANLCLFFQIEIKMAPISMFNNNWINFNMFNNSWTIGIR